jgi:Ca2+-binding EF-hand superfamily protein
MVINLTKITLAGFFSVLLVASLSTSAVAASKEIRTGDIKENKVGSVIAKAPVDKDFKALDSNGDGKITLQEAVKNTALATQFNDVDLNHDGVITADEYALYATSLQEPTTVN